MIKIKICAESKYDAECRVEVAQSDYMTTEILGILTITKKLAEDFPDEFNEACDIMGVDDEE